MGAEAALGPAPAQAPHTNSDQEGLGHMGKGWRWVGLDGDGRGLYVVLPRRRPPTPGPTHSW